MQTRCSKCRKILNLKHRNHKVVDGELVCKDGCKIFPEIIETKLCDSVTCRENFTNKPTEQEMTKIILKKDENVEVYMWRCNTCQVSKGYYVSTSHVEHDLEQSSLKEFFGEQTNEQEQH
jgi:hypothetical protein